MTNYQRSHVDWLNPLEIAVIPNGIPDPLDGEISRTEDGEPGRTVNDPEHSRRPDQVFEQDILPERKRRLEQRLRILKEPTADSRQPTAPKTATFRCLFLAHCTEQKGLFDAIDAVALANAQLAARNSQLRTTLAVAGQFVSEKERHRFENRIAQSDLQLPNHLIPPKQSEVTIPEGIGKQPDLEIKSSIPNASKSASGVMNISQSPNPALRSQRMSELIPNPESSANAVRYLGYVAGVEKNKLMRSSDCLLFPSRYPTEVQPVALIESLAYGLPIIAYDWHGIAETIKNLEPENYYLCEKHELPKNILAIMCEDIFDSYRKLYEKKCTINGHLNQITAKLVN